MLRHIVLLRFTDSGTGPTTDTAGDLSAHVERVATALRTLPSEVPSIRDYRVDVDLGLAPDNAHLVVTADFDDVAGHAAYRDHAAHVDVIERLIRPRLERRSAVQFEI